MINRKKLKPFLIKAEQGYPEAIEVVKEVLRPLKTDSVENIQEKIHLYTRLFYHGSLKFKDAQFHKEIDQTYAEQVYSFLRFSKPRYKQILIIGFRESAKTTRVKMNQSYLTTYLPEIVDYVNVVSDDGSSSAQFIMDMFNAFALSNISKYFKNLIEGNISRLKKESQTRHHFTTTTDVTYAASGSRKTKRGAVQGDVDEETGDIITKRPKEAIFDDIENETTVRSLTITKYIRSVMNATMDGLDQTQGFSVILGNYLSLRGNIAYFLKKYRDSDNAKVIMIPIHDGHGEPTWSDKYCKTDKEAKELSRKGIARVSVETIRRESDNFDTEFLNNPSRSDVYFKDNVIAKIDEELLTGDEERDKEGLLVLEEPTEHDRYIMGVDTAKGSGGDQSAFVVYKTTGMFYEEVCNFRINKMSPEKFTPYSINVAERYNHAFVVPENNYPGNEYIYIAKTLYNHIYFVEKNDAKEYGISTNLKTKPEMFVKYKKFLIDEVLRIRSKALYNQILEYPADDVETIKKDDSGGHFDLLMSGVIGIFRAEMDVEERMDYSEVDGIINRMFDDDDNNNL